MNVNNFSVLTCDSPRTIDNTLNIANNKIYD
jgi:hypothetical protein